MALIINVEKGDINLDPEEILDLSDKGVKKLEKCGNGNVRCLLLDNNDLARLENVESYGDLLKLSVTNNKLVRMYGVCRLVHLRILNLANNSIVAIEGMRELVQLTWLRLSGNKIKLIEHLSSNGALEYLDLSNNCIASLANVSHLKVLHTLNLDDNNIKTISHAATYLPATLKALSLANNELTDLNQISYLCGLPILENVSITNNPCILMTGCEVGFDYRPFVINWCQNLKLLDGFMVGSKESLKAEWLYSMGKGRHYQAGEHAELSEYLSTVCPLTSAEDLVTEEDAKLSRILNKRRQHQQQLLQELSTSAPTSSLSGGGGVVQQRRPATAPAHPTVRSTSSTNLGAVSAMHAMSASAPYATERSASASAVTASRMTASFSGTSSSVGGFVSSAMTMSMSAAIHHKPVSPARHYPAAKKKAPEGSSGKYADESSISPYELVGLMSRSYPGHYNGDDTTMFIVSPPDVPSDVPELCHEGDSDAESPVSGGGGASQFLLRSESQYVPVPETMLSPDFRPVAVSGGPTFELASDAQPQPQQQQPLLQPQPPTPEPDARPRWLQRSAIPRSTFAHSPPPPSPSTGSNSQPPQYDCEARAASLAARSAAHGNRGSATDSPILRRPTQVLRLQRTARPVSLSPSCGRRSPAVPSRSFVAPEQKNPPRASAAANATSSSDEDSTDSEVSVSKLALVREAAQTKMDAIVRRSMTSSMESSLEGQLTTETDSPLSSTSQPCQEIVTVPAAVTPPTVNGVQSIVNADAHDCLGAGVGAGAGAGNERGVGGDGGDDERLPGAWWSRDGEREGSSAAVKLQALWRGFRARRCDPRVVAARQEMRVRRAEDHVRHLTDELARARRDLDRERKLRELQMEAIRALWVEVQNLQDANRERDEPERDSGHDSPGLSASSCPPEGVIDTPTTTSTTSTATATVITTTNSQPRRCTTSAKSVATGKTRTAERDRVRPTDESSPRSRPSSRQQVVGSSGRATGKTGSPSSSVKSTSPRPDQQQQRRRRDENQNYDAATETSLVWSATAAPSAAATGDGHQEMDDASAAEKMVHLTDTCNNLQSQVQQLQEALRTISCLLLGSHLQNRPAVTADTLQAGAILTNFCPPAAPPSTTNPSPPFFSALASPLSNDGRSSCLLTATNSPTNVTTTTTTSSSTCGDDNANHDETHVVLAVGAATTEASTQPLANGFYPDADKSPSQAPKVVTTAAVTSNKLPVNGLVSADVDSALPAEQDHPKSRTSFAEAKQSRSPVVSQEN